MSIGLLIASMTLNC